MKGFMKKIQFLVLLIFISNFVISQITVPISEREYEQYNRERQAIKAMKIDLSQTWMFMVKNNVISNNKLLLSEVYFNKEGLPEIIVQYDENQNIVSNTTVKYNAKNLPFEEIKFSKDSSLINGVLFEYDQDGLLIKQINYNEDAVLTAVQEYTRKGDTIFISVFDNHGDLAYVNILLYEKIDGISLLKSMYKVDKNQNVVEESLFDYNELYSLRRKTVYDDKNSGTIKNFVYNSDGAMLRTIISDENGKIISDTSYEYDDYGNVIRIIEYDERSASSKLFFINYLSLVKE